jgi:hypothetical protein
MRRALLAIGVIATVSGTVGAFAATGARDAAIAGWTRDCGGPAPGRCWNQPGVSVAVRAHHRLVARETSDRHGWFHFALIPGSYSVRLESAAWSTHTVRARAHRTTHVVLVNPVP